MFFSLSGKNATFEQRRLTVISGISGFTLIWGRGGGVPKCCPTAHSAALKAHSHPLEMCRLKSSSLIMSVSWEDKALWLRSSNPLLFFYSIFSTCVSQGFTSRLLFFTFRSMLYFLCPAVYSAFIDHLLIKGRCLKSSDISNTQLLCLDCKRQKCHHVLFHPFPSTLCQLIFDVLRLPRLWYW